ncbi:MAG: tyrosine--tRNA ligase [Cryomorphaceae bacterium]|nr:MAG: tyrosine--tRNA ligase [Cryomorphaceae bacterium]
MPKNFFEELKWRGLIQDSTPGIDEEFYKKPLTAYIGFDPTSDSLHIGSLVQLIILKHLQEYGHKPILLIGGATGMIGDPSGKSKERNLLGQNEISANIKKIKNQVAKFLDFENLKNPALMLNNYDWISELNIIDFFRDYGKSLTVNYMMSKESVKKRISSDQSQGMSFTEFTYQLFQAYDFYHLLKNYDCKIQMGGSDQWGNITSGIELIRKKTGQKSFALTCPLITKSDGSKFGKTEEGNVWLDRNKTSPYKFYQYWLNSSDKDSENYIKIFTLANKNYIDKLISDHRAKPHQRLLQKYIANELTQMVHSKEDLENVIKASEIFFGKSNYKDLDEISEDVFLEIFEDVPSVKISKSDYDSIPNVEKFLQVTGFFKSNSDIRRSISENSVMINKERVNDDFDFKSISLIKKKYILTQKGKKNYFLVNIN